MLFIGLWMEGLIWCHEIVVPRIISNLLTGRQACLWAASRSQLARLP
jgi:hypothetical protein